MKLLLSFVFIFSVSGVLAQSPIEYQIVDLSITRKLGNYPFYIESIIDNRPNKEILGVRTSGFVTYRNLLKFEEGFQVHLAKEIDDLLWPNDKKLALTMQINELWYDERYDEKSKLHYHVQVKFELIYEKDGKKVSYGEFEGTDSNTRHHVLPGTLFRDAFEKAFEPLKKRYWNKIEPQPYVFKPSVPRPLKSFDYHQPIPVGFYRNFEDLIERRVKDDIEFKKAPYASLKGIEKWKFLNKSGVAIKNYLFYFDGEDLYTQYSGKYFIGSHFIGKYIYYEDIYSINESTVNNNAYGTMAAASLVTPVIGQLIGVAAIGLALSQRAERGMVINTETGTRIPLVPPTVFELFGHYPDLWDEYEKLPDDLGLIKDLILELNKRIELEKSK